MFVVGGGVSTRGDEGSHLFSEPVDQQSGLLSVSGKMIPQ